MYILNFIKLGDCSIFKQCKFLFNNSNYWNLLLLIRLEPAGLLLFEMAKSKQKPFPL